MGRLANEKPSWLVRLQPWVGALVVALGLLQLGLQLTHDNDVRPRALLTGFLMAGGGAGMIARRARGWSAALFLAGAAAVAASAAYALTR